MCGETESDLFLINLLFYYCYGVSTVAVDGLGPFSVSCSEKAQAVLGQLQGRLLQ